MGEEVAKMPSFPMEFNDYMRMTLTGLSPREYMATSRYDYELAADVQAQWNKGVADAQSMKK